MRCPDAPRLVTELLNELMGLLRQHVKASPVLRKKLFQVRCLCMSRHTCISCAAVLNSMCPASTHAAGYCSSGSILECSPTMLSPARASNSRTRLTSTPR